MTRLIRQFFCILALTIAMIPNAMASNVFVIQNIETEATAKSAVAAREIAFHKALDQSFRLLARRIISKEEFDALTMPDIDTISNMVMDFEITKEKSSTTSYRATYTVRYNKKDVQNFLGQQNVNYADLEEQNLLILPFLQNNNTTTLWDERNVFLTAWQQESNSRNAVTKIIAPIKDLQDMIDIKDQDALSYKPDNMARLVSRYNAKEAVIVIASPQQGIDKLYEAPVNFYIYKTDNGRPEYIDTVTVSPSNNGDLVKTSVKRIKQFLQEEWKRENTVKSGQGTGMTNAVIRYPNIDQWISIKETLERHASVEKIVIKSLRTNEARVEIHHSWPLDRLAVALERGGLTVNPIGAGLYEVRRK